MSASGPKRTSLVAPHMSAFGGKADIDVNGPSLPLLTQSGHSSVRVIVLGSMMVRGGRAARMHEPDRVTNLLFHIVLGHSVIFFHRVLGYAVFRHRVLLHRIL